MDRERADLTGTAPDLLPGIPGDRPVPVVAEGLLIQPTEADGTAQPRRIG